MKKFLLAVMLFAAAILPAAMTACTPETPASESAVLSVYAPDGAPALALASLIGNQSAAPASEEAAAYRFDFHVIDASTIEGKVSGETPDADFCILPLNTASDPLGELGTEKTYQMLGTVTWGNMYFLTTGTNPALTKENLKETLTGKKVGVVQLKNVPGLTLQATLKDYDIPYTVIESAQAEGEADKVNLVAFTPDNVTPAAGCDYYLVPEPAASLKIKMTADKPAHFIDGGDLQALYGEGGYPQAVMIAKKSVISQYPAAVAEVMTLLEGSADKLKSLEPSTVIALLAGYRTEGLTPAFTEANLTKEVIARCGIRFVAAKNCKSEVNAFLEKLTAINEKAAKVLPDAFFYGA